MDRNSWHWALGHCFYTVAMLVMNGQAAMRAGFELAMEHAESTVKRRGKQSTIIDTVGQERGQLILPGSARW